MVILRPTQKLRSLLPFTAEPSGVSDTALGDWYINRLVVDRRSLLVLISSIALLPLLGILVDTAKTVPYHLDAGRWDDTTLPFVEARLAQTPWHCSGRSAGVIFADQAAPALLQAKWGAGNNG
ncbi:MAG: hypothetical protein ABJC26_10655 [Gemmatimonadaceae bacterium]